MLNTKTEFGQWTSRATGGFGPNARLRRVLGTKRTASDLPYFLGLPATAPGCSAINKRRGHSAFAEKLLNPFWGGAVGSVLRILECHE